MKPLKLEMQAFGTFANKTIIDFSSLNDKVFLIYGKTGSGKTTIFDAICFALYGEVTGDLRNKDVADNVRSSYSDNKTPTYVCFKFQIKSDTYQITRYPGKQQIEKRLTYFKNERVEVLKNDVDITKAKVNETNDMIESDIIKLTRSQFKQTMMISQGDFAALIKSDSKERTAIFRTILDTSYLNDVAQKVKNDTLELEKKTRTYKTALVTQIKGLSDKLFTEEYYNSVVNTDGNYAMIDEITAIVKKTLDENSKAREELDLKIIDDDNKLANLSGELATITANNKHITDFNANKAQKAMLDSKRGEIDELQTRLDNAKKAESINNKLLAYNNATKIYTANESVIDQYSDKLSALLTNKDEIEANFKKIVDLEEDSKELNKRKAEIDSTLKSIAFLGEINKEIEKLNKQKKDLEIKLNLARESLTVCQEKHDKANKYILDNANIESKISEVKRLIEECDSKGRKIASLILRITDIDKNNKDFKLKEDELEVLKKNYEVAKGNALIIEGNFIKNQAGYIAKSLKEGLPCPVCGSIHHPKVCDEYDESYSKEKVDEAKKLSDEAKNKYDTQSLLLAVLEQKIKVELEQVLKDIAEIANKTIEFSFASLYLEREKSETEERKTVLKDSLTKLETNLKIFEENKKIVDNSKELDDLSSVLEKQKIVLETLVNEISSKNGEAKHLEKQIANQNRETLSVEMNQIITKIEQITAKVNEYRNAKNSFDSNKLSYEGIIKQATSNQAIYKKNMHDALASLEEIEKRYGITRNEIKNMLLDENTMNVYSKSIEQYRSKVISIEALIKDAIANGVDKLEIKSTKDIEEKINFVKQERSNLNTQVGEINELENMTKRQLKIIDGAKDEYLSRSKEYIPMKEIDEVLSGEVSKKRITFETFYQVQFFKQILRIASKRFNTMTDGKYSLVYKEELDGGAKKTGLDMEVIDNYNGVRRTVGSLSGGESFMASLALALSMSDIIQAKTGGISLDSMFIDEGFGTLDPEALNNAIDQIAALSCNGKTVGLISHVEELKNRIPTQIHVIKKENGSIIE